MGSGHFVAVTNTPAPHKTLIISENLYLQKIPRPRSVVGESAFSRRFIEPQCSHVSLSISGGEINWSPVLRCAGLLANFKLKRSSCGLKAI